MPFATLRKRDQDRRLSLRLYRPNTVPLGPAVAIATARLKGVILGRGRDDLRQKAKRGVPRLAMSSRSIQIAQFM